MIQTILSIFGIYISFTSANRLLSSRSLLQANNGACDPVYVNAPDTFDVYTAANSPGSFPSCGTSNPGTAPSLWFQIPGQIRNLTVSTCELNSMGSADYDTKISIFKPDDCGCINCDQEDSFICVDGIDDISGCSLHSTVSVPEVNCDLYVVLFGYSSASGTATVDFQFTQLDGVCPDCGKTGPETKQECETCLSWSSYLDITDCRGTQIQPIDFEDIATRVDDCAEGFMCLLDDGPGVTLSEASFAGRRLINVYPEATVRTGICVPSNGTSITTPTCETNNDCPSCMRCCGDGSGNGIKQCVRSSGDICGLEFSGRGPCCCPEYTCCENECITQSPTQLPTPTPIGYGSDDDDDDDDSVDESPRFFGAEQILGSDGANSNENENVNMQYITDMGNKILITLWSMIGVIAIGIISMIILGYLCLCRKKGQASFTNDHADENI